MSLPLRITFGDSDYSYTVLTKGIGRETTEIKISFQDEEYTLMPNEHREWYVVEDTVGDEPGVLKAIAKNVALRYRL